MPGISFGEAAPAHQLEADARQRVRRLRPDDAKAHDADGHFARRRLRVAFPDPLALLRVVEPLAAVKHQRMQHAIFGHAHAQIRIGGAHERQVGQGRIGEHVVGAGAEIEDDFEISKLREQSVRRAPDAGIGDVRRIADTIGPQPDVARGEFALENLVILGGLRTVDRKEDGARGHDAAIAPRRRPPRFRD